jgi:flavin-dependent dehydrogenase
MRLVNGNRSIIVGGGPAGSFTALHLIRFAAEARLELEVTILEPRDFSRPGPDGCNKCAGILSSSFIQNLERLGLSLPPEVIQSELDAYILHLGGIELPLYRPDPQRRIVSVYRGSGPRLGNPPSPHSFDNWLLEQAQSHGANLQRSRAQVIQPGIRPIVSTNQEDIEADLVVLATGVNSRSPLDPYWGYRPPPTEIMAQDEVPFPSGMLTENVHIFFDHPPGLIFGGLIPKDRYANISLLGRGLSPDAVSDFLEGHGLISLIPEGVVSLCGCTPRVAVASATGYYDDRLVVVGDAAVTRLYKDGIGAAFITAEAAARTAIQRGISRRDFADGYRPVCRQIATDNLYGRLLFRLWEVTRRSRFLHQAWMRSILEEIGQPNGDGQPGGFGQPSRNRLHQRVLWGMFTGDESYRQLFWLSVSWPALRSLWRNAVKARRER